MSSGEVLIYIAGVVAMLAGLFAFVQVIKEIRKEQNHTISVQIPEEADKAIQKIAESYITLDKARTEHPITEQDVQASLLEARAIVAAHLKTRIAIVTGNIEKLSRERGKSLKYGYMGAARREADAIKLLEEELQELQTKLNLPSLAKA